MTTEQKKIELPALHPETMKDRSYGHFGPALAERETQLFAALTRIVELTSALERLRANAQRIFDKVPVKDWDETLAEADAALKERT